jgi:hypothetical protein
MKRTWALKVASRLRGFGWSGDEAEMPLSGHECDNPTRILTVGVEGPGNMAQGRP